jgi:[ribosomal protein S18]-alanine N-acetyltransferase
MAAPIVVRRLRAKDLDFILLIEKASFGTDAYDRNLFAEFLGKCGDLFLAAERKGRICGYLIACIRDGAPKGIRTAELVSVATDPQFRGLGVASRLMDSTLRRLRLRHVDRLVLMVRLTNGPARAFYEKYGFRRVRVVQRYYEDGADGLLMALRMWPEC